MARALLLRPRQDGGSGVAAPAGLTLVPGDGQLRITWQPVANALGYKVYVGGRPVQQANITSTMIDELPNGASTPVQVSTMDSSGEGPKSAVVSDTPYAPEGPAAVASLGPNGTHWADRTPHIRSTPATVVEVACTWAAIKAAIAALTAAQVNAGVKIVVQPGTLPGYGYASASTAVIDTVGDVAWRKRVLVCPRDGRSSVTMSGDIRFNKMMNVTIAGFDCQGIQFSGCSYSALAWCTTTVLRMVGLGGQTTQGFDCVEVVKPDVQVGDVDSLGIASGYPGSGTGVHNNGNAWMRFCRVIGVYVAPQYLPYDTYDANGNQLTGYGHNDSLQLYGSGVYYGFTFRDTALFGANNSALQIGGFPAEGPAAIGQMEFFMRIRNCLLLNAAVGSQARYPIDSSVAKPLTVPNCINGVGLSGYHYVSDTITSGSLYYNYTYAEVLRSKTTSNVSQSNFPAVVSGAWTYAPEIANWTAADVDPICPKPTPAYLNSIWTVDQPPTLTESASQPISGATQILPTSTKMVQLGAGNFTDPGTIPGYYRPDFMPQTTGTIPMSATEFTFTGTDIAFGYTTRSTLDEIRVSVDGVWASTGTTTPFQSAGASNTARWLRMQWPTARTRRVRIDKKSWDGGLWVADTSQVTTPTVTAPKVVAIGTSLLGAKNAGRGQTLSTSDSGDYTNVSSYGPALANLVGWEDFTNWGIGGAGFFANGDGGANGSFGNRIASVIAASPKTALIEAMPFNDLPAGKTPSQITAAFNSMMTALRAALPASTTNVICFLNPNAPALASYGGAPFLATYNDPIRAACPTYNAYAIDPLTGNVYDTNGTLLGCPFGGVWGMPDSSSTYITSDGVHPTHKGSMVVAQQMAAAVALCMAASSWQ